MRPCSIEAVGTEEARLPKGSATRAKTAKRHRSPHAGLDLLRSKLDVPPSRPGLVERERLVSRLTRRRTSRVVSIVAPPGYGKTTLLAQWAQHDRRQLAWVSLDHRDNDPVVFLTYLAQALNSDGAIGPSTFKALAAPGDSLWARGLPRLSSALASRDEPLLIVLDDVHELVNHECLDALGTLLSHLAPGSELVLAGRMEARLGLPRLRAEGELLELGVADLGLTDNEAFRLLHAAGLNVSEQQANALNEHAEGWPAGLYLAALSLERADTASLDAFGGDDRYVTDYLRSEHLSRIRADQIDFLTKTSVLDRMCPALCDAVLERADSAAMLDRIEAAHLLVVPLDNRREWYRYHHLLREMLVAELGRREPELAAELNRRAARWSEQQGDTDAAIDYWWAAGEVHEVARIVLTLAFPYYRSGRVTTVERWLGLFDDQRLLERHPGVAVFGVWTHALRGRPELAERWAAAIEACDGELLMPDGSPLAAWAASARALLCRRGLEQMEKDAVFAIEHLSAASPWRPLSLLLRGVAMLLSGDEAAAEAALGAAAEAAEAGGAVYAGVTARSELALLALARDDLAAANAEIVQASALVEDAPSYEYVVTGILFAATARLAIAQGRGAEARQALAAAQRIRPALTYVLSWFAVQTQLELARAHLSLRDVRGASALLHEAEAILRRRPRLGTLVGEAESVREELLVVPDEASGWASTLTAAELRLLPLLTTHLTFREIAERLFVTRNTVKTQAISVYRKLGASSRSEAIDRAAALGLVDASTTSRT